MNNQALIFLSIDTIEDRMEDNILISELASQYGFSLFYYSRLFKGITGISPKTYIQGRKLTMSTGDLISQDMKIIDIAFKYGFGSHEAYTRAFQKLFGLSPSRVRKEKRYPRGLGIERLTPKRLERMHHLQELTPDLVTRDKVHLVGISFYYDIHRKNDLSEPWSHLMSQLDLIRHTIEPKRFYQLQYWFPDQEDDAIYFFLGVEVSAYEALPIQLTEKTIPKHEYLRFRHKGLSNQVGYTYQYIYKDYLPKTDYHLPHMFNFEYYGDDYLGPYNSDSISDIYIPIEVNK